MGDPVAVSQEGFLSDNRVQWLRQRISLALDLSGSVFDDFFTESLERARSAGIARMEIASFLGKGYGAGSSLFFSAIRDVEDKEIEEDQEIEVEAEPENNEEGEGKNDETAVASTENSSEEKKDSSAADNEKKDTDGEVVDEEAEPTPAKIMVKKIIKVKKIIQVDRCNLLMGLDKMTPEMHDRKTCYFIKCEDGEIDRNPNSSDGSFSQFFEFGVFNGEILFGLANLMNQIYIPTIKKSVGSVRGEGKEDNLKHELNANMAKFEQQIRQVVQQVQGDVRLEIPAVTINDPEYVAHEDYEVRVQLEKALVEWSSVIATAVEGEVQKVARKINRTPLGEIEFWRERTTALSALYEQINMPRVQLMIQVLKISENPQLNTFQFHFGELTKLYLEAKDNVKFLTTLERHFKHLTEGSFNTINDSMFAMLNGLKMVWVISRHYNSDDRMSPLMENIAKTLVKRVREEVKLNAVFEMDFHDARKLVQEAGDVLIKWKYVYQIKLRIEMKIFSYICIFIRILCACKWLIFI